MKKLFFGWSNFKWLCREIMAMYSNSDSYFSKKRIESSAAFIAAMIIIIAHVSYDKENITNSEILADATLLFVIAGYTVNQIQKEKSADSPAANKTLPPTNDSDKKDDAAKKNKPADDYSKDEDAI